MAGTAHKVEGEQFFTDRSRVIECSPALIHQIRTLVLERFNQIPHGGGEVFGVLFGSRENQQVSIVTFRPLPVLELAASPAFGEEDRAAFRGLVSGERNGDGLAGLTPVGWFRSHPRSELDLGERDCEIFNSLFPEPWQVAMLLRPGNSAPTRVRFYFRNQRGGVGGEGGFQELTLPAEPVLARAEAAPQAVESAATAADDLRPVEMESAVAAADDLRPAALPPPVSPPRQSLHRAQPSAMLWAALLVAGIAVAAALYWVGRAPQQLALRVVDSGGQLRITWNRAAAAVKNAQKANLEITDGSERIWLEIDADQLRTGNVTYMRKSGNVMVRLTVSLPGVPAAEEVARFLGPPVRQTADATPPDTGSASRAGQTPLPANPAELVVKVPVEPPRDAAATGAKPPAFVAEPKAAATAAAPELVAPPVQASASPPLQVPETLRPVPAPADKPAASPVDKPAASPVDRPATPAVPGLATPNPPPSSPAAQSATRAQIPARTPAAPASGRLIWIGRVQKNEVVAISGKNASSGTLIGELPAKPVKFSVSPGDLSGDGIVLYTSNLQYANSVVEPPGQQNGWNRTVYTWNPRYANDVSIQETPGPQNNWSRIALRIKSPKISVIVIDWALVN